VGGYSKSLLSKNGLVGPRRYSGVQECVCFLTATQRCLGTLLTSPSWCGQDCPSVCPMSCLMRYRVTPLIQHSSAVVHHLRNTFSEDDTGLAFVYCNYKESEGQTTINLVGSMLQQLVQRRAAIPIKLRLLYEQHLRKKTKPTLAELSELLHVELTSCSRAFLIVDALDECDETRGTHRDLMAELLRLPSNTSLMITSREIPSIRDELNQFCRLEIQATEIDIRTYLERCIERESRLKGHVQADPVLGITLLDTVVTKVQGMLVLSLFPEACSFCTSAYRTAGFFLPSCTSNP
jgi:hypothetical protein